MILTKSQRLWLKTEFLGLKLQAFGLRDRFYKDGDQGNLKPMAVISIAILIYHKVSPEVFQVAQRSPFSEFDTKPVQ